MEFCGKLKRDCAAGLKKFSKLPCCLNTYNEFLGVFCYMCLNLAVWYLNS